MQKGFLCFFLFPPFCVARRGDWYNRVVSNWDQFNKPGLWDWSGAAQKSRLEQEAVSSALLGKRGET